MNSRDLIRQLEQAGWQSRSIKGSHRVYRHPTRPGHVSVPHPKKDLGAGLVNNDTIERVNITLPRRILALLDQRAKSAGESRSGYIARMTLMH